MPLINSMRLGAGAAEVDMGTGDPRIDVPYTAAMVDEAAQNVLGSLPAEEGAVLYEMWSRDSETEVVQSLMRSQAQARLAGGFSKIARIKHTDRNVHTDDEVRDITRLYGEFDISFENVNSHDHAMGASVRPLDFKLLKRNKPPGMRYKDFGGSIITHVEQGDKCVTVVAPNVDDKDPVRKVLMNLRMKKIASGAMLNDPSVPGGQDSVEMAKSVLSAEGKYLVEVSAQEDKNQALFGIACHVYDIPLADWPGIMERGGTHVVDGCLHFSNRLMEEPKGIMGVVRQRYEIDAECDEIRMGFEGSSAPWYRHKWSEYMRYGVDQVLAGEHGVYSYKIVSRKGDTIFFRILRVGQEAKPDRRQYYDTPGIGMVEVDGFDLERTKKVGKPVKRSYTFPQLLWERMVRDASMDIMKTGKPDVNALVGTYRVASVNHSYNSVNPLPTAKVEQGLVMALAVHAAIAGYAEVLLVDTQAKHMMKAQLEARSRLGESTLYKFLAGVLDACIGLVCLPLYPVRVLANAMDDTARDAMAEFLVTWRPVARVKQFKAVMFLNLKDADVTYCPNGAVPFVEHMADRLPLDQLYQLAGDPELAGNLLERCGHAMPEELRKHYQKAAGTVKQPPSVSSSVTPPPSYHTEQVQEVDVGRFVPAESRQVKVEKFPVSSSRTEHRLAAIREAIEDVVAVTKKIESEMRSVYLKKFANGEPVLRRFQESPEKFRNPDAWRVVNGVLTESLLGNREMSHAAVWLDRPRQDGQQLLTVAEEHYDALDAHGAAHTRRHFTVGDPTFSGWAIVTDDTAIFNGPNVLAALEESLTVSHDYTIVVNQAGAGAGKTTSIVNAYAAKEVVVCPVRMSTDDTRDRLEEKIPDVKERRLLVRTIDSLLVNWGRAKRQGGVSALVMHGDEVYMARAGLWYAAAGLLGVSIVSAHGDEKQIPCVPRVDVAKMYLRVQPDIKITTYMVYRCAPSIMAIWAGAYDCTLRTPLSDEGAHVKTIKNVNEYVLPPEGTVAVLVMYQAQKLEIKKVLTQVLRNTRGRVSVMTVHESEGRTFDHVLLVNTEVRPRMSDKTYLWGKSDYVLVGASRGRRSLTYAKYGMEMDMLATWMARVTPMHVRAVCDVESAGTSVVKL